MLEFLKTNNLAGGGDTRCVKRPQQFGRLDGRDDKLHVDAVRPLLGYKPGAQIMDNMPHRCEILLEEACDESSRLSGVLLSASVYGLTSAVGGSRLDDELRKTLNQNLSCAWKDDQHIQGLQPRCVLMPLFSCLEIEKLSKLKKSALEKPQLLVAHQPISHLCGIDRLSSVRGGGTLKT